MEALLQQQMLQRLLQQTAAPDPVQASLDRASAMLSQLQQQQSRQQQPADTANQFFSFGSPGFGGSPAPAAPAAAPRFNVSAAVAAAAQAEQASGTTFFSFDAFDAPKEDPSKPASQRSAPSSAAPPLPPAIYKPPLPVHPGPPTVEEIEAQLRGEGQKKKKADKWACPTCDEINKLSRMRCQNCNAPQPADAAEREIPEQSSPPKTSRQSSPPPARPVTARSKSRSRSRKKKAKKEKAKKSLSPLMRKRPQKSPSPKKGKDSKHRSPSAKKGKDSKHKSPSPKKGKDSKEKKGKDSKDKAKSKDGKHRSPSPKDRKRRSPSPKDNNRKATKASKEESKKESQKASQASVQPPIVQPVVQAAPSQPAVSSLHRAQTGDALWQQSAPPKVQEKPAMSINPILAQFMAQQQAAQAHANKKADQDAAYQAKVEAEQRARDEAARAVQEAEGARLEALRKKQEEETRALEESLRMKEREAQEKREAEIRQQRELEHELRAAEEARQQDLKAQDKARRRAANAVNGIVELSSEDEDEQQEQKKKVDEQRAKIANEMEEMQDKFAAILAAREQASEPGTDKKEKRRHSRSKSRSRRKRRSRSHSKGRSKSRRKRSSEKDRRGKERDRDRRSKGRKSRSRKRSRSRKKRSRSARKRSHSPDKKGVFGQENKVQFKLGSSKEEARLIEEALLKRSSREQPQAQPDRPQASSSQSETVAEQAPQSRQQMMQQAQFQLQMMGTVRQMRMQLQQIQQTQILPAQMQAMLAQLKMLEQLGTVQPQQQDVLRQWQQHLVQFTMKQQQQQRVAQELAEQQKRQEQEQALLAALSGADLQHRQSETMKVAMTKSASASGPAMTPLQIFKGVGKGKFLGKEQVPAFPPQMPGASAEDNWDSWGDEQPTGFFAPSGKAGGRIILPLAPMPGFGAMPKAAMRKPQQSDDQGQAKEEWDGWGEQWDQWGKQPDKEGSWTDWSAMPSLGAMPVMPMSAMPGSPNDGRPSASPPSDAWVPGEWKQEEEEYNEDFNHMMQNSWNRDYAMEDDDDDDDDDDEDDDQGAGWHQQDWQQQDWGEQEQKQDAWQKDDDKAWQQEETNKSWQDDQAWWQDDQTWKQEESEEDKAWAQWQKDKDEQDARWTEEQATQIIEEHAREEAAAKEAKGKAKGKGKATVVPASNSHSGKIAAFKKQGYAGTFTHPALGNSDIVIRVSIDTAHTGRWVAAGQTENISVEHGSFPQGHTIRLSEKDGTTKLEGQEGNGGMLWGVVIQEGVRGGKFQLRQQELSNEIFKSEDGEEEEEEVEWSGNLGKGKKGKGKGKKGKDRGKDTGKVKGKDKGKDKEKEKGKGKGKKEKKEDKKKEGGKVKRIKVAGMVVDETPPDKFDKDHWEEPRKKLGLKLLGELAGNKAKWNYVIKDESRRSFAAFLSNPFTKQQTDTFFKEIKHGTEWLQPRGSFGLVPRKTAWMVKKGCNCHYRYGGSEVRPQEFPPWMAKLLAFVMPLCGKPKKEDWPDSCNLNTYEDGSMSVGWHSDDERLFQGKFRDIAIISLSFGQTRKFELRTNHPEGKENKKAMTMMLGNGDLATMEGMMQKHYQHRVPKEPGKNSPRINLTWRWVEKHEPKCPSLRARR